MFRGGRNAALLLSVGFLFAQDGPLDPDFAKIPFEEWRNAAKQGRFKWSARVSDAGLSAQQRLMARLTAAIDAQEFVKRRDAAGGIGQFVFFMEVRDSAQHIYQTHRTLQFNEWKIEPEADTVLYTQEVFAKPGDYHVTIAIYDTNTKEHAVKKELLRVAPLPHDPLLDPWQGLPAIEFVPSETPPENWFFPTLQTRLHLLLEPRHPVHVELLVNESPSEKAPPAPPMGRPPRLARVNNRNMAALIPAMKVISQIDIRNGSLNAAVLDLSRRKVSFEQQVIHGPDWTGLDWKKLRAAIAENDPNMIDVHALEHSDQNAQFFVSEVRKRAESKQMGTSASEPQRVMIVLSAPMSFPDGTDLTPIAASPSEVEKTGCRVYYIRFSPPPMRFRVMPSDPGGRGMIHGRPGTEMPEAIPPSPPPSRLLLPDSLAGTLKPLTPRLFDVATPLEFRRALAAILDDLAKI